MILLPHFQSSFFSIPPIRPQPSSLAPAPPYRPATHPLTTNH